jgi:hypothetical protein
MKFSHSIQFNAVPDWSTHYISYSNLKKLYVLLCSNYLQSVPMRVANLQIQNLPAREECAPKPRRRWRIPTADFERGAGRSVQ